jgi:3-hydroxyacyl-[acyl-carrier-protein] dehydratase
MVFLEEIAAVNRRRKHIRVVKRFKSGEAFFRGHFPGLAMVPGIFLVEGMAQAGLLIFQLAVRRLKKQELPVLTHVDARFMRPVFPNQRVVFEATIERCTRDAAIFRTTTKVRGALAAHAEMTFAVKRTILLRSRSRRRAS